MKRAEKWLKRGKFWVLWVFINIQRSKSTTRSDFWRKMTIYLKFYVLLH